MFDLKISAMALTKALLNALPLFVSNIVLHSPCLVKKCVYNAEVAASTETLFTESILHTFSNSQ